MPSVYAVSDFIGDSLRRDVPSTRHAAAPNAWLNPYATSGMGTKMALKNYGGG